jgi:hypothetical protein
MTCEICNYSGEHIDIKENESGDYVKMYSCNKCGRLLRTEVWKREFL